MIFQYSMIMFHVNLQGYIHFKILRYLPSRKKENRLRNLPPILMEVKSRVPLIVVTFTILYSQLSLNHDYGRNSKDLTQPEKTGQFGRVLRDAIPMKKITFQDSDW